MLNNQAYDIYAIGFDNSLTKTQLFDAVSELDGPLKTLTNQAQVIMVSSVSPNKIMSGEYTGDFRVVNGYMQSSNYVPNSTGWKFDARGNLEANSGLFRGSIYASSGLIGGWAIDNNGLYYSGSGNPSIRTAENVGYGGNGVVLDSSGIRGFNATLGIVFNLPTTGGRPELSSGVINETVFEISTNSVLRTSSTVGNGGANSQGVIINNSGIYACGANQTPSTANVRILASGDAFFQGTINASTINGGTINGVNINASIITSATIVTKTSGQRIEMNSQGITMYSDDVGATYGDSSYKYGNSARTYGSGVLAYVNNSERAVPIYFNSEQAVADMHLYNRSSDPTGAAEIGDICMVGGDIKKCTVAGTPGTWVVVG